MFNNILAADQNRFVRFNLNTVGADSIQVTPVDVLWHSDLRHFLYTDPAAGTESTESTASASPAEQIAQLKRQLAEMQKSLSALEAALQPAKPDQPSQRPAEKKPPQETDKPQP
jgi:hypothetical protein